MSWLIPLGFLGLIGLAVLLLIYLLKPNYQQKSISSTFVWKLSLKYKKRRNPISKLRNLLILLCQILIITACAFVMAQPAIADETNATSNEKVVIIDGSASMLASNGEDTRFERAVTGAAEYVEDALGKGMTVTVILAARKADYLAFRINSESEGAETIATDLENLIADPNNFACSFGTGDIEGAKNLAEEITIENPLAEVFLYTGTTYLDKGNITVVDVSEDDEFNVALLDCGAVTNENYYNFTADVASYGRAQELTLVCEVDGINIDSSHPEGLSARYTVIKQIPKDTVVSVIFDPAELDAKGVKVFSFKSARITAEVNDSFLYDNMFDIYGGTREEVKIQYYSTRPNPFFKFVLLGIEDGFRDRWEVRTTEVERGKKPAVEGFDIYIFEHSVPNVLPTDGVVILADPNAIPTGVDMVIDSRPKTTASNMFIFSEGDKHPITQYVTPSGLGATEYIRLIEWNKNIYTPLLYCNGDPVVLCENNADSKLVVMAFSVNMATPHVFDFASLFYGIFNYYIPTTTDSYVYDVNQEITLNARGNKLEVSSQAGGEPTVFDTFPSKLLLEKSGSYILKQKLISGKEVTESVFVRIPNEESNIVKEVQILPSPVKREVSEAIFDMHIMFIILGIAAGLLFIEWILHSWTGA